METDTRTFFAQRTSEITGLSLAELEELCAAVDADQFPTNVAYRVAVHDAARDAIEEATGAPASRFNVRVAADHVLSRDNDRVDAEAPAWEPCDRGVCAAEKDHDGTCAKASGWGDTSVRPPSLRDGLLKLRHSVATEGTAASWTPERFIVRLDHLLGGPMAR